MMDRVETGDGFSVLDCVALVMGAAVASIHIRGVIREGMTGHVWVLVSLTFSWVALTATGPFLLVVRRFAREIPDYPKVGDYLWALLGFPWLVTAFLQSTIPDAVKSRGEFIMAALSVGLAMASLIALGTVWTTWVMVPPEQARRVASTPWTNRVGLSLAVAWPIQCGIGMVVGS
ncbi:hypothetical protein ACYOEI_05605 [Singulisphaera rosea]